MGDSDQGGKVRVGWVEESNCYTGSFSSVWVTTNGDCGRWQVSCSRNTDVERSSERETLLRKRQKKEWNLVKTVWQLVPQESLSCCSGWLQVVLLFDSLAFLAIVIVTSPGHPGQSVWSPRSTSRSPQRVTNWVPICPWWACSSQNIQWSS